jgi:predicted ATPase/DNA-binding CsgD family transcriptional regulator
VATGRGVPAPGSALVGRGAELAAVRDLLTAPATRLVTITGAPGVGKTRLAQAVAAQLADDFPDGVAWVELASLREPGQMLGEVARALDVGERSSDVAVAPVAEAVGGRTVLVVLDNCEHLLDGVPQIAELLAAAPGLRILATSRERLYLTVEQEYPLRPLPMPSDIELADLDRLRGNPSIALLLACAPTAVQLTSRTSQALADICVRLDGLPLAIELAAARLRVFTPSELAFRLEHRGMPLTSSTRDLPGRHRDITSAIAWSHDLLPDNERLVFRCASVFAGPWTIPDAVAITPALSEYDVVAAVESLLEKSLVRRFDEGGDTDQARFSMLFSVREFAAARLDECGETDDARRRHLQHFADVATLWERTVGTDDETITWPWTELARLDMLAALEFGRQQGDVDATLRVAATLGWYWYTHGTLADVAGIREIVTTAAEGMPVDDELLAAALIASGIVSVGLGDHDAAERDLSRAAELSGGAADHRRLAIATAFLGHAARGRGEYELAAERYAAARTSHERQGSRRGTAWVAHDLGVLAYETGDYSAAVSFLRTALESFRELDYAWAVAVSAWGLATALIAAERPAGVAELLAEALVIHDSVSDRRGVAQCLESLASLAVVRGDAAMSGRLLGAAAAWRASAAARPSRAEQARVAALDDAVARILGRDAADAEQHIGRVLPPVASIALAAAFAASAIGGPAGAEQPVADTGELTARQRDVAALIAAGHTNRQIGRDLGISEKTAEVHVRNIMERLDTPIRAGVAAWAASRGLTRPAS